MIPNSADQCGLIRKSDVERLISYLKTSDTKDKDKESNNDECRLDSVSPTGRKRSQSPFSSGPPTRSTSALSHENSIPTDTNEYCPIVKKPKPNVLETELTETTRSTYGLDEKPANSTSCMEPIPLASSQLKSGHSDNDPKVTFFILTNCKRSCSYRRVSINICLSNDFKDFECEERSSWSTSPEKKLKSSRIRI